ncbi:MAG: 7-cyano-7-deazaguanine synthase QueC [Pseudomonadota bacterium]|nr:7-cyano-7-deazaguanine synthase QueC [Pseudomonadota bacterium]
MSRDAERAVVLLSGGLDSTTTLAIARTEGFVCHGVTVDYGQRHRAELASARAVADAFGVEDYKLMRLDLDRIGGSALTDPAIAVPEAPGEGIPVTYVPARNTVLLGLALAYAETIAARDLFIGVNALDYSGYPDCRPEFIRAFEALAQLATKAGVEGARFRIHTPLIALSKSEIIQIGARLGVDYGLTVSCYQADDTGRACGRCDACRFRSEGFAATAIPDPTRYR